MATIKIVVVAGARPNFVKVAPLMKAFEAGGRIAPLLVHTGQHYDQKMSQVFFEHLGIAPPAVNLGVGSGSHAAQTAAVMTAFEPVLLEHRPVAVLVVGDVNSTIACGLVAAKLGVTLVHVEAGLRSFDRTMPEEINRLLTDAISDVLFCTERSGVENLRREGVAEEKIFLVGNVMVDSLLAGLSRAGQSTILRELGLERGRYAVLTLHRPSNVDDGATLAGILAALGHVQHELPIVFPVHPRTLRKPGPARDDPPPGRDAQPADDRPGRVPGLPATDVLLARCADRLGRHSGGDHDPQSPLPDTAGEYRATGHG